MNLDATHSFIGTSFSWTWSNSLAAAVLIVLAFASQFVFRKLLAARWLYALWLCVLLRLMMPVLPQSSFSIFNLPSHLWNLPNDYFRQSTPEFELPQQPSPIPPGPQDPAVTPTQIPRRLENSPTSATRLRFLDAAPYLWLLGALGYLTVVLAQHRKLSLWLKSQRPLTHHRVVSMIEDVARSLHLRRTPRAYETNCLPAPSLFGFWKPRLLLPKALLENLSDAEFRLIVLHELIHAKRRDVLLNWVTIAVQSLHWFNPFVWLAMSRLRAARELARDAAVMSHLAAEDRQGYGATLIKLVAAFSKPALTPTLIPVINRKKQMHRRITMIANFKPTPRLVTVASAVVLFAIACLTFTRAAEKPVTAPPGAAGKQSLQADASKDAAASKRRIDALEMAFAERDESVRKQEQRLDEMKQKFGISQTDDSA